MERSGTVLWWLLRLHLPILCATRPCRGAHYWWCSARSDFSVLCRRCLWSTLSKSAGTKCKVLPALPSGRAGGGPHRGLAGGKTWRWHSAAKRQLAITAWPAAAGTCWPWVRRYGCCCSVAGTIHYFVLHQHALALSFAAAAVLKNAIPPSSDAFCSHQAALTGCTICWRNFSMRRGT